MNRKGISFPSFAVRSGLVENDSKLYNPGISALYWSRSSGSNSDLARYLYFNDSNVWPSDYNYRYRGFSLRCPDGARSPSFAKPLMLGA